MAAAQRREKKRANMMKSLARARDNGYVPFTRETELVLRVVC